MFTLLILPILFVASGVAIDLMRQESVRVRLQQGLDLCALAGASLEQTLDPKTAVSDCLATLGLKTATRKITVEEAAGMRRVTIEASAQVKNLFLQTLAQQVSAVSAFSQAQQRVLNFEVVLVLDISGSMAGIKLAALKDAAKGFVSAILTNGKERVSIAIVPYNSQVYMAPNFHTIFNAANKPVYGTGQCIDLPDSAFAEAGLPKKIEMSYSGIFDYFSNNALFPIGLNGANMTCIPNVERYLVPPTDDIAKLNAAIDGLVALGGTSIHSGVKWAGILLSNELQPKLDPLVKDGTIPSYFANRPVAYSDETTQKIIILMTDGELNTPPRLTTEYKSGPSPIFVVEGVGWYYHVPEMGDNPYLVLNKTATWWPFAGGAKPSPKARRLDWSEVWPYLRINYVNNFHAEAMTTLRYKNLMQAQGVNLSSAAASAWRTSPYGAELQGYYDALLPIFAAPQDYATGVKQLQAACVAERSRGVVIYGITFFAGTTGQNQIRSCATSPAHFFTSSTVNALNAAFQSIAMDITQLRLTK